MQYFPDQYNVTEENTNIIINACQLYQRKYNLKICCLFTPCLTTMKYSKNTLHFNRIIFCFYRYRYDKIHDNKTSKNICNKVL